MSREGEVANVCCTTYWARPTYGVVTFALFCSKNRYKSGLNGHWNRTSDGTRQLSTVWIVGTLIVAGRGSFLPCAGHNDWTDAGIRERERD